MIEDVEELEEALASCDCKAEAFELQGSLIHALNVRLDKVRGQRDYELGEKERSNKQVRAWRDAAILLEEVYIDYDPRPREDTLSIIKAARKLDREGELTPSISVAKSCCAHCFGAVTEETAVKVPEGGVMVWYCQDCMGDRKDEPSC